MGRNSKRKAERKAKTILLAGEQAEVFDAQMDSDRDWFECSDECVRFRPEIEGEWSECLVIGSKPQQINIVSVETGREINMPFDWVCVVDIGRVLGLTNGKPSGLRTRFQCHLPVNEQIRQGMASYAISYAAAMFSMIKKLNRPPDQVFTKPSGQSAGFMLDRDS